MKLLLAATLAAALPMAAHAADGPRPRNRAEATEVIRDLRRIVTPEGIERAQTVSIGEPGRFLVTMVEQVRPIAAKAGDVAP